MKAKMPRLISGIAHSRCCMADTPQPARRSQNDTHETADTRQTTKIERDQEMIRRAQLGDARAWEILVRENINWILKICRRWTYSTCHSEDLTQDVFIKVFQNLHMYKSESGEFRKWLGRITRNLLIDHYRKSFKDRRTFSYDHPNDRMKSILSSIASREFSPEVSVEYREQAAALSAMVRMLDPELREALILRHEQDLSYGEISDRLKLPEGTVKSRISRARMELARLRRSHTSGWGGFNRKNPAIA
jgi:RNA polymerase sigma-70 factor (ECF subfamily)